ncbi:MAG: phenylalanine--tRNA ligase subunit beta [Syntrophobacteraceae bacterium]
MIISLEWLRDYVDVPLGIEALADRLTMVGLEVEAVHGQSETLSHIVTARVQSVLPHPNADKLRLCDVWDGATTHRVVCGAPNVAVDQIVPLALPGARLPSGMTIQTTQIRGQVSGGMLCSQIELGLGDDASGIWVLGSDTPIGARLSTALGLDAVRIEIGVTPNRGDCLSHIGVAREVSAICQQPVRYPDCSMQETGPAVSSLAAVAIDDPVGCPRYSARVIEGVRIGPSPEWLRKRLEAVGVRSINNIVDVTNYVMMELGQPLHAFDHDLLREHRIVVRRAVTGEEFTTLDGEKRTLFDDTLLICDGVGPVAIAGIMGGLDSEITEKTTRVLIESAYFDPTGIRRSSKKLGLRSESSFRFERGIDPEGTVRALDRATQLMAQVAGGVIAEGRIDVYPLPYQPMSLTLRVERTNRFLGTELTGNQMAEVLRSIQVEVTSVDDDRLTVTPPPFRPDLTREVDLQEEIARLVGYDRIPVTLPISNLGASPQDLYQRARQTVKDLLQSLGLTEVINYSFIGEQSIAKLNLEPEDPRLHPVRVRNPLSEEQGVMRTSLIPGILQTACRNFDHRNENLRIFEVSKIFLPKQGAPLPDEPHWLAGALAGARLPDPLYGLPEEVDLTDAKGVVESVLACFHLDGIDYRMSDIPPYLDQRHSASVFCGQQWLGAFGPVHPQVAAAFDLKRIPYLFELDFDRLFALRKPHPMYRPLPKYPEVARDMAIVVDASVPVLAPLTFMKELREPLLEQIEVFDIFRHARFGENKKSLGYRLVYRAADRSLTDEEVNALHSRLTERVLDRFHATLR